MSDYYDVCYECWRRGLPEPTPDSYDYLSSHRGMEDEAIVRHYEQQQRDREYERQRQEDQEEYDRQAEECAARMLRDGIDPAEVF